MAFSIQFVTDQSIPFERLLKVVDEAIWGGVSLIQFRDKEASEAEYERRTRELVRVIDARVPFILNDRLDVAVRLRSQGLQIDGVHLGQGDEDPVVARQRLGESAIIGWTADTAAHLEAVEAMPQGTVDYLGVGIIHPTGSKDDAPSVLGIEGFAQLASATSLPCVAIGGIGVKDIPDLVSAGAAGAAVISAISFAQDPRAAAGALRPRKTKAADIPRVLSIAGTDPTGGAGIQADLKSIAAMGGYGMAVVTALVAQNTEGVRSIHVPPVAFLQEQLEAVSDDVQIDAVKLGMLHSEPVITKVREWMRNVRPPLIVLDPVMVATSKDRLLDDVAEGMIRKLCREVDVVTPNIPELAVLVQEDVATNWESAITQARRLARSANVTVILKGGHLPGDQCPDAVVTTAGIKEFTGRRVETTNTHGTGCSLSSALATLGAQGKDWEDALPEAKSWLTAAIEAGQSLHVGHGNGPVDHFYFLHPGTGS